MLLKDGGNKMRKNLNVKSTSRKKGGRGTHGSTTKAGKVRTTTPKIPRTVKHKKLGPKLKNRRNYEKRILLKRDIGQNWKLRRFK